jgi:Xaa-Pro dipeptidase
VGGLSYRHYHAAMMRTIAVGEASDYQRSLYSAVREAIEAMTEALSPGRPVGEIDNAHRRVLDAAGLKEHRFAACGYALGTTFSPTWVDKPMLYSGNPVLAEPGMVFFLHCIVLHCIVSDSDRGIAMSLGYTCLVTDDGREVLSKQPLDMIVV